MKQKNTRRGFTLIELLVVVLIIGLLAAVALPQYNKAVKKAQGVEVLDVINALDKALHIHYLEYGKYSASDIVNLNIQLPELKHFKYVSGMPSPGGNVFNSGSSSFSSIQLGNNFPPYYNGIGISMVSPEGAIVSASWLNGEMTTKMCLQSSSSPINYCSLYFQCDKLIQTGTGNSSASACYLK